MTGPLDGDTLTAAIEAAAKAAYEYRRDVEEMEWERGKWERLDEPIRNYYLADARRAVTAAAPIITAAVAGSAVPVTTTEEG